MCGSLRHGGGSGSWNGGMPKLNNLTPFALPKAGTFDLKAKNKELS
jgi:hypothetical protein